MHKFNAIREETRLEAAHIHVDFMFYRIESTKWKNGSIIVREHVTSKKKKKAKEPYERSVYFTVRPMKIRNERMRLTVVYIEMDDAVGQQWTQFRISIDVHTVRSEQGHEWVDVLCVYVLRA